MFRRPALRPSTPSMARIANTHKDRILGATLEPFDGRVKNAEMFWNNLKNYYYLNENIFPNEGRKVTTALTYFKLGTPAGD